MVRITETDEQKENSHHRYTGAVRVDFPRGVKTVDVDDDVAQDAVATYETVEYADDVDADAEAEDDATRAREAESESGMERQSAHEATGRTEDNEPERNRTPAHVENEAEADADADADAVDEENVRRGEEP